MKRLAIAALALSLMGGSAAVAQPDHRDNGNHYGQDHRYDNGRHDNDRRGDRHDNGRHHWARGERLPAQYRTRGYYVDYRSHHLRAPPRGYQWVRVDNNYVMVALATGVIASILASQ